MRKLVRHHRSVDPAEAAMRDEDKMLAGSDFTAGSITRENLGASFEPVSVIFRQVEAARVRILPIKTHLRDMKTVLQTHINATQVEVDEEGDQLDDIFDSAYE
jgi:hypothetical protein